jgi:hypothetical protein
MHSFLIINDQEYFYNLILFTKHIKDMNVAIRFIKEINQINNRDQFNFKSNFNKMLINNDVEIIKRFIDIMLRVIIESSGIPNYHSIDIPKELSLVDKFDYYIIAIDNMSENENYILHNKLQIMKNLISSKVISCDFSLLSKLTITGIDSIRILNNYRYKNCVNRIWTRIYSNIQIDYDGDFNQFVPISLVELIYNYEE